MIKVDISELVKFQDDLQKFDKIDTDKICRDCAKELAARLLQKVIKRTPVGQYNGGKVGGTLKKNWTVGEIVKNGDIYEVEIINQVEYASYVEYGHRTVNHKGWVEGRFMLTVSEKEINNIAPALVEKKLEKALKECFDD